MKRRPSLRAKLASIPPSRLVLFLDFDGTLVPIVSHPNAARLDSKDRRLLDSLARALPVVIVSGRPLEDVRSRVGVQRLHYIGHHGLLYRGPDARLKWFGRRTPRRDVRQWVRALHRAAKGVAGALVEDKTFSAALHDRGVSPAARSRLRRQTLRALAPWLARKRIVLLQGKRVLEVKPAERATKGTAVAALLRQPWARNRVPVYIGDDRTDFDAFPVVQTRGLAVRVGGRRGVAGENAWLPDPEAVRALLLWLEARTGT